MTKNDSSFSAEPKPGDEIDTGAKSGAAPAKTPMYEAMNADRYRRQGLIKQIQINSGRRLICYVSGIATLIDRDDTIGFVDLLHNVPHDGNLDLLLHTGGGDIDAAEKLISMVRTIVGTGTLRVIVPDFAKSAGTLMALAADKIVMSDTSELGPIDPQITLNDGDGNRIRHSIQSYLDAYEAHAETLRKNPDDVVAHIMLSKLDPARLKLFEAARGRALKFAEEQLNLGMFRPPRTGNFTEIARKLMDTKQWLSHGQMISWQAASTMGLLVEYLDQKDPKWQAYWQLYCAQRLAIKDRQKIFESDCTSLVIEGL
jgi:ATP-dependent protease ClpP protease subunit